MPLLVVGENMLGARGSAKYRGTYREAPPHADVLPEDSEYNRLFAWYCESEYQSGVEDPARARRLLGLVRVQVGRRDFEMIEVGPVGYTPKVGCDLLGYDLSSAFSYSLLSWGLELRQAKQAPQLPTAIRDLCVLVEAHFKPLLNEHGLLPDEHSAAFCLRSMMALQEFSPGLWENDEASDFQVVAIYKVPEAEMSGIGAS
jgi:hypothetical protein